MGRKELSWTTKIVDDKGKIRGYSIDEIIDGFSFEEAVNLLVTGHKDSGVENHLMRANIMSHCSHGVTGQSTLSVLMSADTDTRFGYAAFSGFLAGSGKHHTNAIEHSMRDVLEFSGFLGEAEDFIRKKKGRGERITGYGHRFHLFDPRARVLLDLCDEKEFSSVYLDHARKLDRELSKTGVRMNLDGAGAAIMLTQGIPPELGPLINFTGRSPAYAAHYIERRNKTKNHVPEIEIRDFLESDGQTTEESRGVQWRSNITDVREDALITYGHDQRIIIRSWSYEDMVFLLLMGKRPTEVERELLRRIILSYVDHGLYDRDVVAVRFSADLRVPFIYAGSAAFNTGSGSRFLGKLYEISKSLYENRGLEIFRGNDNRSVLLDRAVKEYGFDGPQTARVRKVYGRSTPEFESLAAGVLLDMGISYEVADLFPLIGRSSVWASHHKERLEEGKEIFQRVRVYDFGG